MIQPIGKPFTILIVGGLGPNVEESIYRAFLIGKVKTFIPLWNFVIISNVLFALRI